MPGLPGDLNTMLKPLYRGIFQFTGFSVLAPQVVYGPSRQTPEERSEALNSWAGRLNHIFDESPITITPY
ncbi:hypothetical protein ACTJJ0_13775 [Chitinophaga sp. 22321]|uniref:Flavodoxin-like fold n=1 Tax=Chitinophaga hostae TaxID=2831022 RepID=A0ABS5J391_9BACT|nr:hypothetical protein [Chitinophaga hostae]MBS0029012.1 hypothetical protein [Chitinophaga hostae]